MTEEMSKNWGEFLEKDVVAEAGRDQSSSFMIGASQTVDKNLI